MRIKLPTREEEDQANRFRTYLNYLLSISDFVGDAKDKPAEFVGTVIETKSFRDIQGGRSADIDKIGQLLRNAWFTEIQMDISGHYEEFVSYSNHWIPVQVYYAAYLTLRAYYIASGQNIPREHSSNLKAIAMEIHRRPDLFPQPWKAACVGNPENGMAKIINLPQGISVRKISPLSSSSRVPFWDSYGMFLKTTRFRQLETLCDNWKIRNKKGRMNSKEKQKFIANLVPTSLFHALYRLRLRSNYADADSFLLAVQGSDEGAQFHHALQNISWYTLLVLELLIARYIGKQAFTQIVEKFRKYDDLGRSERLICSRWQSLQKLW